MRPIPQAAVEFIAAHEGLRTIAYLDSAQVPTIGYGHIDGVKMGDRCTKAQALMWLSTDLEKTRRKLYGVVKPEIIENALTTNQYAALLSFVFNLGAGAGWTIWKRLNAKQFDQIPGELIKFVNADGKKIIGLVNRRADEVKLWSTDEPGSVADVHASSQTRTMETPPTPADPTPPQRSGQIIAGATAVVTGVPVAVSQVTTAIAPYATQSDLIQKAVSGLAVVAAAAVVLGLVLAWMKKREQRS